MHALMNRSRRGPIAAYANTDPVALVQQINAAFGDFRTAHDGRMATIEAAIDDLNRRSASDTLGGGGVAHSRQAVQEARAAMVGFMRTGAVAAVSGPSAGMTTQSNPDLGVEVSKELELGTDFTVKAGNGDWLRKLNFSFSSFYIWERRPV